MDEVCLHVEEPLEREAPDRAAGTPPSAADAALRLSALREISEMATRHAALAVLFERIVAAVCQVLRVDLCSLMLVDEQEPDVLRIQAARGLPADIVRRTRVRVGERISGRVVAENRTLLVENVEDEPDAPVSGGGARYRTKSLLSVPIRVEGRAVGVLNVNNKVDGTPFDQADRDLLETLCNQAGLAIENARLVFDLVERNRALADANEELRRLNMAKSELIIGLSHEFRTPLTVIQGYADLLEAFWHKGQTERLAEWTAGIRGQVQLLVRHVSRIFDFFSAEVGDNDWAEERIALPELLAGCVEHAREAAHRRGVEVLLSAVPEAAVQGNRGFLEKALAEVLDNAVRFTREEGWVRVSCAIERGADGRAHAVIAVADEGPGIPPELVPRIFDDFKQTDDVLVGKPDGLGLGLAIARTVAVRHGGDCRVARTGSAGTTIELRLPVLPA